ncbi:MAG: hypothetical protein K0R17_2243 [Rariglobus sp.]|jgi:hypothetical protein|nr:hypothetical protein [Rariglobus sp.]
MAWITPTENDAYGVVNEKLMAAARTKVIATGQADPLFEELSKAVGRVRGAIGASGKYTLGAGDTVPFRLKEATMNIFAVMILGRLDLDVSEVKMTLYKSAEATLRDVRDGKFDIGETETPTDEASAGNYTPEICGRERQWGRDAQDGA